MVTTLAHPSRPLNFYDFHSLFFACGRCTRDAPVFVLSRLSSKRGVRSGSRLTEIDSSFSRRTGRRDAARLGIVAYGAAKRAGAERPGINSTTPGMPPLAYCWASLFMCPVAATTTTADGLSESNSMPATSIPAPVSKEAFANRSNRHPPNSGGIVSALYSHLDEPDNAVPGDAGPDASLVRGPWTLGQLDRPPPVEHLNEVTSALSHLGGVRTGSIEHLGLLFLTGINIRWSDGRHQDSQIRFTLGVDNSGSTVGWCADCLVVILDSPSPVGGE